MSATLGWFHTEISTLSKRLAAECIESGQLTGGHFTDSLERELTARLGSHNCIYTNSGTSAIAMSLIASGAGEHSKVSTAGIGWIATPQAVQLVGATPIIIDVLPETPLADVSLLNDDCEIFIPVNYNGRQVDLSLLRKQRPNLLIIEDSCKSLFSTDYSRSKQSGTNGRFGCFSLGMISALPGIYGGIITTVNQEDTEALRIIKWHGVSAQSECESYKYKSYNFKTSNVHAAVALGMLDSLEERLDRLKSIYYMYKEGLEGLENARLLPVDIERGEVSLLIDVISKDRPMHTSLLRSQGLLTCNYHRSLSSAPGVTSKYLPNSEYFANCVFHPPCGPDQDLNIVKAAIKCIRSLG